MHFKIGVVVVATVGFTLAQDQQAESPTQATEDRGVYFPNSEDLAPDEMRIISLGTGMPYGRIGQAAATSWLVELGNGAWGR